jgi:L-seryl-tRNA(Ser) seleniumtransferase
MEPDRSLLKRIPSVDALLKEPGIEGLGDRYAPGTVVALIREELDDLRRALLAGGLAEAELEPGVVASHVVARAEHLPSPPLRRVINATGILIHTNLGRAPLSAGAQRAVAAIQGGYCNLEMDLGTGKRTSRLERVRDLLRRVTGAEEALAVNNNAAAIFLALHVLAAGREVIVSRGELVEIGGSFRLPDVMAASGARLREVGTTNRTRIEDYRRAIGEQTAMVLKVHPSNFAITGYTEAAATADLAELAHRHGLVMMEDIGSGALDQHPREFLREEPRVQESLRAGADLVCFSGDKLLGGPQAGVLLGGRELIERLRTHPLARVVRLDKLHLAALEATLLEYLAGAPGLERVPLYRLMRRDPQELRRLGADWIAAVSPSLPAGWRLELIDTRAAAGGGSLPGETLASVGVAIDSPGPSADALARHLREGDPAIVGRIEQERLILDLRSLLEEDWETLSAELAGRLDSLAGAGREG